MSQIGNEKGGLEMIGRLVGSVDGKAGRGVAKTGGGAQDFARLMASVQGRLEGGQGAPAATGGHVKGGAALPEQLRSSLNALSEEMVRLRQRLASDTPSQAASEQALDPEVRAMLDRMVETLSASRGQEAAGRGRQDEAVPRSSEKPDTRASEVMPSDDGWVPESFAPEGRAETRELGGLDDVPAPGETPAVASMEKLTTDESFARAGSDQAEALADWRRAMNGGDPAQVEATVDTLRDRLAALSESMQDGGRISGDQPAALAGQLQALQQLMARAETGRSADTAARGGAESRAWSDWSWRMAAGGQQTTPRAGTAAPVAAGGVSDGDASDWSGGPVTAALGLAGREMPTRPRQERISPTHWSALGGFSAQAADATTESMSSAGMGQATSAPSLTSSGSSPGGIFTGQSATPPPNPQMPAQLGQQIQWMVGKGVSRANIELRPADLGPLRISIETQGDETRIALTATNATTQGLLEQQLPRLKEWLQESGLAQSEVDVSLAGDGDFGQQLASSADGDSSDRGGLTGDAEATASAGSTADGRDAGEWVDGQGVLDLFA